VVDPEKIRMLIEMMSEHDLSEISLRDGEEEVVLKRGGPGEAGESGPPMMSPQMMYAPMPAQAAPAAAPPEAPPPAEDEGLIAIKSPMVGTFYAASDPNAPPYVSEGSTVTASTVVCIVEAMKVFNEIKAEVSGTIAKCLVKNEEPVEFGQPLFMVRPD
jgi:acetyl-CoA carboxylase biotin carboxyl carrier protein